jgi:hypothetical protein
MIKTNLLQDKIVPYECLAYKEAQGQEDSAKEMSSYY